MAALIGWRGVQSSKELSGCWVERVGLVGSIDSVQISDGG